MMSETYRWEIKITREGRWHEPWSWSVRRIEMDRGRRDVKTRTGRAMTKLQARRRVREAGLELMPAEQDHIVEMT